VSFPRVIEKGRRGIEEDERFRHHNGTVMETGCKKMQNNFSGELKISFLAKVNNMQIKVKSSSGNSYPNNCGLFTHHSLSNTCS